MPEPRTNDPWGAPTEWTRILRGDDRDATWRFLLKRYRGPVLTWVRARLRGHPEAEDVAFDFFQYLWERGLVERADPHQGKFRAYLQGILSRYLHKALRTTLRHPGAEVDGRACVEPTAEIEAEEEAAWAARILHNACKELLRKRPRNGAILLESKGLKPYARLATAELAAKYGLQVNALYKALHDAKADLRELLRLEVLRTVHDPRDHEEEWRWVRSRLLALRGGLLQDVFEAPEPPAQEPS